MSGTAAETYDENQLKAAITYNVAKFVKWPEGAFLDKKSPLIICVLGSGPAASGFSSLEGQVLGEHPVHVKYLKTIKNFQGGHVVYIVNSQTSQLDDVLHILQKTPVLTISDIENFASRGGMINLVKVGKNIRFVINLDASMAVRLQVSSKLYGLATEVIRSGQ